MKEAETERREKGRQAGPGDSNTEKLNTALLWRGKEGRKQGRGRGSKGKAAVQHSPTAWPNSSNLIHQEFRPWEMSNKGIKVSEGWRT